MPNLLAWPVIEAKCGGETYGFDCKLGDIDHGD